MKNKRAQLSLGDAPSIVLIVGLTFLMMATLAYIGVKYGDAVATKNTAGNVTNETYTPSMTGTTYFAKNNLRDISCGSVTYVANASGGIINAANYTQLGCSLKNNTQVGATASGSWKISYPYTWSADSAATDVTDDLNTEISNNTSIAGIVLTISLVGIVLTVLIGIFVIAKNRGM